MLAPRQERVLSKALTFRTGGSMYCVKTSGPGTALRGARVTLLYYIDGSIRVHYKDQNPGLHSIQNVAGCVGS
jgi:hypothetical protein